MFQSIIAQFNPQRSTLGTKSLASNALSPQKKPASEADVQGPGTDKISPEVMKLAPTNLNQGNVTKDSSSVLGGEAGNDLIELFERNLKQPAKATKNNAATEVVLDPISRTCGVTFVDDATPKKIHHDIRDKASYPKTQKHTIEVSQINSKPEGWRSGGGINFRDHNVECLRSETLNQYLTNMGDKRLEDRSSGQERRDVREMVSNTVEQLLKNQSFEGVLLPLEAVVRDTSPNCTGAASGFSIMHEDFSDPFDKTYDSFHQRWSRTATERLRNITQDPSVQFGAGELRACKPIKMINAWVLLSDKLEADPLVVRVEDQKDGLPEHRKVESNLTLKNNENFNTVYIKSDDGVEDQWITLGKANKGDMLIFDSQHSVHGLSAFTDQPETAGRRSVEVRFVLVEADSLPPAIKESLATQSQNTQERTKPPSSSGYSIATGSF